MHQRRRQHVGRGEAATQTRLSFVCAFMQSLVPLSFPVMSRQIRGHSRDSRPAADNRGLATSRPKAMLPPNTSAQAAALRSVLSNMSDEELLQYKAAFQNYDADEDGYLDLPQAMKALHSCGVPVSSGAMLDSLDDLEEAAEGDMNTSEWEQEQGRRRRRRRRHSLESMEERVGNEARRSPELQVVVEQTPAASPSAAAGAGSAAAGSSQHESALPSPDPNEQKQASATDPSPRMRVMRGPTTRHVAPSAGVELDRANSSSSLRSPSIDISTFLNLLQRRTQEQQQAAQPHYISSHHHRNNSGATSAATTPAATSSSAFPRSATTVQASSRPPLSSSQPAGLPTSETWPRSAQPMSLGSTPTGTAATAATTAPAGATRPFMPVSASSPAVNSIASAPPPSSGTNSPRLFPTLRLRDHSASENRLQILGLGHSLASRLGAEITGHGPVPPIDSVRGLDKTGVNASAGLGLSRAALQAAANDDDDDADFDPEQDLLAAFHTFDPTHSGTMSIPHLMAVMTHMGEKWSEEEAGEMAEEIDTNHDGRFNYRQLVKKLVARE